MLRRVRLEQFVVYCVKWGGDFRLTPAYMVVLVFS